jgi:hypothetical protein
MRRLALLAAALGAAAANVVGCSRPNSWQRADFPSEPGDAVAGLVAGTGPGQPWLAVGSREGPGGPQPRWWSAAGPGGAWHRGALAFDPISEDGKHSRLLSAARLGSTTAAIGYAVGGTHGNRRPVLWVLDGPSLRETYLLRELFGGPRIMTIGSMAAGPHGFFVTGTRTGAGDRQTAQVWTAAKPPDWTRIDDQPALASTGPHELVWGFDVAASPAGPVVVVGRADEYANGGTNPTDAAAWYSADGRAWRRATPPAFNRPGRQELDRVAATAHGFVAVGRDRGDLAVWKSKDGASWVEARWFKNVPVGPTTPMSVASDGTVAVVIHHQNVLVVKASDGSTVDELHVGRAVQAVEVASGGVDQVLAVTTDRGVAVCRRRR